MGAEPGLGGGCFRKFAMDSCLDAPGAGEVDDSY